MGEGALHNNNRPAERAGVRGEPRAPSVGFASPLTLTLSPRDH